MNKIERLTQLEAQLTEEPVSILIQVVEKIDDEIVIIDSYYLNERGFKYGAYK
jgi:hypothetical protein